MRSLACWDCRFEFRQGHGCLSVVRIVCRLVEFSGTSSSLVQRSSLLSRVSECDLEAAVMNKSWPTSGFAPWNKKLMYGKSKFSLHVCVKCLKYRRFSSCVIC